MYHSDEMGRRRSARTQGLPPPSPSNTPQIDFLTDNNYTVRSNDTSPSSKSIQSETDRRSEITSNHTDDLLSFAEYYNASNEESSSDNLLSMTNSQQSHTSWPNYTQTTTNAGHKPNNPKQDQSIEQLQQTIKMLNDRLGMLEATSAPKSINDNTPVKPSPPPTLPKPSAPIQTIESKNSGLTPK